MSEAISPVEILRQLGLGLNEAKVFLSLLTLGPATAKTVSKHAKVAREIVYQAMRTLGEKGLVEVVLASPKKFRAIPMEEAIDLLLENKTVELKELDAKAQILLSAFKEKQNTAFQLEDQTFIHIPKKLVVKRISQAIDRAQKSIDLYITWKRFSQGMTNSFAENIKSALARNVNFRIVIEKPEETKASEHIMPLCEFAPNCELKFILTHPRTVLGIYDQKEVFIVVDPKGSLQDSPAVWSDTPSIVSLAQDFFEILWATALEL
ncbi:MAG: TrmB family transcriptional regulator [Candidatus Bathyarchaeales archaeon]